MYVPRQFQMTREQAFELMTAAETAQLVAGYDQGPEATLLPVVFEPPGPDAAPDAPPGDLGRLVAHVTRTNDVWRRPAIGDVLAILSGPDAYVAPEWLASHAAAPGVPTWNYLTVHAYGQLVAHDDADWSRGAVATLSARYGFDLGVIDPENVDRMLRAVVGVELRITRIVAKAKLSQNKSPDDVRGIIGGLREVGGRQATGVADAMAATALPHALERYELLADLRSTRPLRPVRPGGAAVRPPAGD